MTFSYFIRLPREGLEAEERKKEEQENEEVKRKKKILFQKSIDQNLKNLVASNRDIVYLLGLLICYCINNPCSFN